MCLKPVISPTAKGYIEGLNLLSSKMRLCSNVPAQSIIQTSLGGYSVAWTNICWSPADGVYEQRELHLENASNSIPGISSAAKPKAAFYIFPKVDTKKYQHPQRRAAARSIF